MRAYLAKKLYEITKINHQKREHKYSKDNPSRSLNNMDPMLLVWLGLIVVLNIVVNYVKQKDLK